MPLWHAEGARHCQVLVFYTLVLSMLFVYALWLYRVMEASGIVALALQYIPGI